MLIIILHYVNVFIWFTTDLFFYVFEVPLHWQANQPSVQCFSILQIIYKIFTYVRCHIKSNKCFGLCGACALSGIELDIFFLQGVSSRNHRKGYDIVNRF